ncbi:MAG: UvrD-helicase domain-containing protein [Firmicutes bacterium]|nr:UvrD-helicase domain-containing protein [Bacillota bacterium]
MNKDFDKESRDRIRQDIGCNFFVEAGAGSGKTTVLVDRMVAMVEGGIDISKICAITFTKAAAGEFYARFQKKLAEAGTQLAREALKNIDLCFMGTIDSFCGMVLSEHPAKAGIPSNAGVCTDEEMTALLRREYSRLLSGTYGNELQEKTKKIGKLFYKPEAAFVNGLKMLMDVRDANLNYAAPPADGIDSAFAEDKARIINMLNALLKHPEAVATERPKDAAASWQILLENKNLLMGSWDRDPESVIVALKDLSGLRIIKEYEDKMDLLGRDWDKFFIPHCSRGKLAWFEIDPNADPFIVAKLKNYCFSVLLDLLHSAVPVVSDTLRKEGHLTFYDCLLYLRDMLKQDAAADGKLIKHIYERHSYFLIDEFQDTNPLQAEVFFYLTAKKPVEDWKQCVPKPGSLFIVGDPKQSIYRFRNADVAAFLKVKGLFKHPVGEVLLLSRNYRSTDALCAWFNNVFTQMLPEDTAIQSRFSPIPLGEKPAYKALLNGVFKYDVGKYSRKSSYEDPGKVADMIRRLVEDPNFTIQGREETAKPRRLKYSDFMIITPAKTRLSLYMNALTELDIPYYVEGEVVFGNCPALVALAKIMAAAADPYNKLTRYSAEKQSGAIVTEEKIFDLSERAKQMSAASVAGLIMDEFRLFARLGTDNAECLYFALELLRQAQTDGTVSDIREGAAFLKKLVNGESDQERSIQLVANQNRVHIANLHKVKGLEASVVILADPIKKTGEPALRVDYGGNDPQSYVFSIKLSEESYNTIDCIDHPDEFAKEIDVLDSENTRLLYVAATRAENLLIVANAMNSKGEPDENNPWLPLIGYIDDDILNILGEYKPFQPAEKNLLDAEGLYDKAEAEGVLNDRASQNPSYEIKRPSVITLKGVTSSEDDYDDKAAGETKQRGVNIIPTLLGTMVHRIMEALVSSRNVTDADSLVRETLNEYQADPAVYENLLTGVVSKIRSGGYPQDNGTPQDILSELLSAEEVFCELPFCYNEDSGQNVETEDSADIKTTVWHGIMDVVYKKDGVWHIIDYKTNADPSDLDEHYREQLSAYEKAFAAMTGQEAKARVYHIQY